MIAYKKPRYVHVHLDRHGKTRIYLRKPGCPKVPLPGPLGSEAFCKAYFAALDGKAVVKPGAAAAIAKKHTLRALIADYYSSQEFTGLADATKRNYQSLIDALDAEYGELSVPAAKPLHLSKIIAKRAETSKAQAKNLYKRMFTLFSLSVKWEYREDNPMVNVGQVDHESTGYETWTEEDIAKFRAFWGEGTPQRIAFEILLHTGLRRKDAVRLGRQHIKGNAIEITASKTGADLFIPIRPVFRKVLDGIKHNHLNLIVTERGASRSEKSFTNWMIEAATKAELPPHRSPHGLRKAACRRLAEAGASASQIMSITGHANLKELEVYVAAASKKKLAIGAMDKLGTLE
ncbi:hypothetical protein A6U87_14755 [Rhizobium sp. AC44/96]|uniref:tyrosine-type recombinase/integrase n=1 Tax=Rhizobium sp. AC44/96 TaxID=1841654 RepID=UPI00080F9EEF|nr:tyrosine-type recombinase/integrase [Rhizobium sp. AC44/96]OCJ05265.1 hypothetical protein A6U87_14755 [Rhizobium sp. AC44/96]